MSDYITVYTIQDLLCKLNQKQDVYQNSLNEILKQRQPVSKKNPFVISFVGRFKTGKSSLMNALIGSNLLPTKATTATAIVTRIFHRSSDKAWLNQDRHKHAVSFQKAKETILNYQVTDTDHISEIIFDLKDTWFGSDIELRDTPGMDDSAQGGMLEKLTMHALQDTDLCVMVFDASAMISARERELVSTIHQQLGGNIVYAVNCTNRLNSAEHLREVEALCQSFFGAMQYHTADMGKYYLMCSAPSMIDLDGFDMWLKMLARKGAIDERNMLRENAVSSRYLAQKSVISVEASSLLEEIKITAETLQQQYAEQHRLQSKEVESIVLKKKQHLQNVKYEANKHFLDTNGLEDELKEITTKNDWKTVYKVESRNVVRSFFNKQYLKICEQWPDIFRSTVWADQMLKDLDFPDTHQKKKNATTGEKVGGAGIGALIGSLFGPVGTIVGAGIGGMIGAADTNEDNSIEHTMEFVKDSVIPLLKSGMEKMINEIITQQRNQAEQTLSKTQADFEKTMKVLHQAEQQIQAYIV